MKRLAALIGCIVLALTCGCLPSFSQDRDFVVSSEEQIVDLWPSWTGRIRGEVAAGSNRFAVAELEEGEVRAGDEVLIIVVQSTDAVFADKPNSGSYVRPGTWYLRNVQAVNADDDVLVLDEGVGHTLREGRDLVVCVRLQRFGRLEIEQDVIVAAPAWNVSESWTIVDGKWVGEIESYGGGVIALRANRLELHESAGITANAAGFEGGGGGHVSVAIGNNVHAERGRSIGLRLVTPTTAGWVGQGAYYFGGGGGSAANPGERRLDFGAGGGGGAYASRGTDGKYPPGSHVNEPRFGAGANIPADIEVLPDDPGPRGVPMLLGSGGGGGGADVNRKRTEPPQWGDWAAGGAGGAGGGIVFIIANSVRAAEGAMLSADGDDGSDAQDLKNPKAGRGGAGGGGGGSGGTVWVFCNSPQPALLQISADGGKGGSGTGGQGGVGSVRWVRGIESQGSLLSDGN